MPNPVTESERLAELLALDLIGAPPDPLLEELVRLAADVCAAPQALISLIDDERQWFKAAHGFSGHSVARSDSVCEQLLRGEGELHVEDLQTHPELQKLPAVRLNPELRFYAGMALQLPSGARIGALCVFGPAAQQLSELQHRLLRQLRSTTVEALRLQSAQRRSRARLLASERQFRALAELSPFGIFHTDAVGRCLYTNPAWQRIYGLSLEQSLGEGWSQTLHPEDRAAVFTEWQRTAALGAAFSMSFRVRHSDGSEREVVARSNPQHDDDGKPNGHVGVVEDITERCRQDRELRLRELQLAAAARLAGVGAWRVDIDPEPVVHWSDQTARIHERPAGHRPSLEEAMAYYPPGARPQLRDAFARAADGGPSFDLVLPMTSATGRSLWVRAVGEAWQEKPGAPRRVLGAFLDITEQREREAELSASNARLRLLYEQTPALLATVDGDGHLLAASNALLRLLDRRRSELPSADWLRPPDALRLSQQWLPRLRTDGRLDRVPCQLANGADMLLSAVLDIGGGGLATALLEDVSAQLRADRELQREQQLREQLQTALDERSEMLDVLAHEVRQPLHNAAVALEAARGAALPVPAGQAVARAQAVLARVRAGVDNTLVAAQLLARQGAPRREVIELALLLQIVAGDLPESERHRLPDLQQLPPRTLHMDTGLTRLALRNVLLNALAYSGGAVRLHCTEQENPPALLLDVSDSGAGFDAALLPRLFERGARGGERGGHGLGLHIARKALRLQGGELLLLHSGPQGSTLRLVLADE